MYTFSLYQVIVQVEDALGNAWSDELTFRCASPEAAITAAVRHCTINDEELLSVEVELVN